MGAFGECWRRPLAKADFRGGRGHSVSLITGKYYSAHYSIKKRKEEKEHSVYMPEVSHFPLNLDIFLLFFLLSFPGFGLN